MFHQDKVKKQASEQTDTDDNITTYACHRVRAETRHLFFSLSASAGPFGMITVGLVLIDSLIIVNCEWMLNTQKLECNHAL